MSLNTQTTSRPAAPSLPQSVTAGRVGLCISGLIAVLIVLWPIGLTGDYLNHLARNFIEGHIWFDAQLQEYYAVSFAVIPDLTMDLIVPWLSHLIGIYPAGAVTVWLAMALPPIAGLFVAKTLHGRVTWLSLAGFIATFNENIQWGFVNFSASTGLALLGFVFWMRSAPGWRRALLFAPFGAFLTLNHALAFLLFGYLVLLWEIACFAQGQRGPLVTFVRRIFTMDAVAMAPGLLLIVLSAGGLPELPALDADRFNLAAKAWSMWSATLFFDPILARVVSLIVIAGTVIGLRRGVFQMDPRMVWVCVGLLGLIVVMPTYIFGIWGLHYRFPAVLLILVAASIRFGASVDRRQTAIVAIGIAGMLATVFVNGALQMARIDASAQSLRQLVSAVPMGARVLSARHEQANLRLVIHSVALAAIDRSAFVPNLFTNTSPVDVREPMRRLHQPQAWPLTQDALRRAMPLDLPPSENGYWSLQYYFGWPRHWDYLVYYRTAADQKLDLPPLCAVLETADAVLYRIEPDGCASG